MCDPLRTARFTPEEQEEYMQLLYRYLGRGPFLEEDTTNWEVNGLVLPHQVGWSCSDGPEDVGGYNYWGDTARSIGVTLEISGEDPAGKGLQPFEGALPDFRKLGMKMLISVLAERSEDTWVRDWGYHRGESLLDDVYFEDVELSFRNLMGRGKNILLHYTNREINWM